MNDGGKKLLSVRWLYLYPVDVHAVDIVQQLSDKRGDGGEFSLFERYSLLVLVDKAFGENVFLLIILIIKLLLKSVMFKNAAKVQLIFCVCLISVFYSLYTIYLI